MIPPSATRKPPRGLLLRADRQYAKFKLRSRVYFSSMRTTNASAATFGISRIRLPWDYLQAQVADAESDRMWEQTRIFRSAARVIDKDAVERALEPVPHCERI